MALIVLMCLCGCAGCGANRYRYYRRGNGYHNLMSYSSYSNEGMQQRHKIIHVSFSLKFLWADITDVVGIGKVDHHRLREQLITIVQDPLLIIM